MLAYILAIAVGLGSIALYLAAFVYPEVHRKEDFYLSALGLFYALVLWVCAGRITGGVLLGQIAGVSLLGWFAWQTIGLRRAIAHPGESIELYPQIQEKLEGILQTGWIAGLLAPITNLLRKDEPETVQVPAPEADTTPVTGTTEADTTPVTGATEADTTPVTGATEADTTQVTQVTQVIEVIEVTINREEEPAARASVVEETTVHEEAEITPSPAPETTEEEYSPAAQEQISAEDLFDFQEEDRITPEIVETTEEEKPPAAQEQTSKEDLFDFLQEYKTIETTEPKPPAAEQSGLEDLIEFEEEYKITSSPTAKSTHPATEEEEVEEIDEFLFEPEREQPKAVPPKPPTPEAVEAAKQTENQPPKILDFDLEEIAPEAEIAPPAEPLGEGDPKSRQDLQEPTQKKPKDPFDFDF